MGRAEDIYRRIVEGGVEAIHGFVRDRESESLFLDFKRSRDGGVNGRLHDHDRNSLAKAISGFGNSEGGVIVWGVECSKKGKGDVASELIPIDDVKLFISLIEGAVSGCTLPPCSRIENIVVINDGENRGFVVTYVPKSNDAPHQVVGDNRYYMRAGSSFSPVPHGVLAGMFGRRPQSNVSVHFSLGNQVSSGNYFQFSMTVSAYNDGPGIAYDPFFLVAFESGPSNGAVDIGIEILDYKNWYLIDIASVRTDAMSRDGFRIAPKSICPLFRYSFVVKGDVDRDILIKMQSGSSNGRRYSFNIESCKENMNSLYSEYLKASRNGVVDFDFLSDLSGKYLHLDNIREQLKDSMYPY